MSCANFSRMEYGLPLVVGGMMYFPDLKEEYEKEYEEEYTEGMYEDDMYFEWDNARILAERFTEGLEYHTVGVESGYYIGFMFTVDETMGYGGRYNMDCLDNEDCKDWYGMCRSKVAREVQKEKTKIKKWLKSMVKDYGYKELALVGQFSNGEAIYTEVK